MFEVKAELVDRVNKKSHGVKTFLSLGTLRQEVDQLENEFGGRYILLYNDVEYAGFEIADRVRLQSYGQLSKYGYLLGYNDSEVKIDMDKVGIRTYTVDHLRPYFPDGDSETPCVRLHTALMSKVS